jgi:hypothetical protein
LCQIIDIEFCIVSIVQKADNPDTATDPAVVKNDPVFLAFRKGSCEKQGMSTRKNELLWNGLFKHNLMPNFSLD